MKKTLSLILSLIMLLSAMPLSAITASATSVSRSSAVSWANSKVGQSIDWDGVYGAQCVDLIAAYYSYLGTSTPGGNGCDYATNALPSGWTRVKNASGVVPEAGDIAVWTKGYNGGKWGHVAIVTGADLSSMTVVEQYGSTDHKTHKNTISYNRGSGYVLFGFIKPNFPGGSTSNGNMTTPTITLNKTNFNYGDTVNISWAKTATGTDFYQYWLVITNTTTGKQIYAGATGSAGDVNANSYSFKINSYGAYSVTVYAVPYNDKNSRQKSATKTFTTGGYTISFNANGGSGAPSSVKTGTNGITAMPSTKPTYNEKHTVTFDANGGTLTSGSKTEYNKVFDYWYDSTGKHYYPNSGYYFNANTTLYAHYSYEKLSAKDPTMTNAYFIGWYDSSERDEYTGPTGNLFKNGNAIISNSITLYAMWSDTVSRMFGDTNLDGQIKQVDCVRIKRLAEKSDIERSATEVFFLDINCNGVIDTSDYDILFNEVQWPSYKQYSLGSEEYNNSIQNLLKETPVIKYCTGFTIKTYPQTTYTYGEEFDYDGIVLQSNYSNNASVHHYISDDIVISGYDPYKIGKQTVTAHFYQWSVTFDVTVNAPDYTLTYDANGGYVYEENKTVRLNESYGTLATPEREGYTFDGWYTSADGGSKITASSIVTNQNDITLYAHWKLNTYSLSFNANGGSGTVSAITNINHGTETQIPAYSLTKGDYLFLGWSEEKGSAFADYENGDSIYIDKNTTLYAVWGTKAQEAPAEGQHVHNYISKVVAPTCTENGYTLKMCSICGEELKTDYTFATGHNFGNNEKACKTCGAANPNYTESSADSTQQTAAQETDDTGVTSVTSLTAKLKKVKAGKKSFTATWAAINNVDGYEIQYSLKKNMKSSKTKTVKGAAKVKLTVKKLKAKKAYYVRIRAYKTINGTKTYGKWSAKKKIKTK